MRLSRPNSQASPLLPHPRRGDVAPGVLESGWRSAITLMLMDGFAVTSQGARIAVLCFCFLALLTTSTCERGQQACNILGRAAAVHGLQTGDAPCKPLLAGAPGQGAPAPHACLFVQGAALPCKACACVCHMPLS